MYKKAKVRSILELLGKNLSAREVSQRNSFGKNTVPGAGKRGKSVFLHNICPKLQQIHGR